MGLARGDFRPLGFAVYVFASKRNQDCSVAGIVAAV